MGKEIKVTSNQINYLGIQETGRHNLATETEANRSNLAREKQNYVDYLETKRSNVAREKLTDYSNREQKRHNKATEKLGSKQLRETKRSNKAQEALGRYSNQTARLNYSVNVQNARSNASQAAAAHRQAAASELQASAAYKQAQVADRNAATNKYNAKTQRYNARTSRKSQEAQQTYWQQLSRESQSQISKYNTEMKKLAKDMEYIDSQKLLIKSNISLNEAKKWQAEATAYLNDLKSDYQLTENQLQVFRDAIQDVGAVLKGNTKVSIGKENTNGKKKKTQSKAKSKSK